MALLHCEAVCSVIRRCEPRYFVVLASTIQLVSLEWKFWTELIGLFCYAKVKDSILGFFKEFTHR